MEIIPIEEIDITKRNGVFHLYVKIDSVKYTAKSKDGRLYCICKKEKGKREEPINKNDINYKDIFEKMEAKVVMKTLAKP